MVQWGNTGGRWTVGLDDLGGLLQPRWFPDSMKMYRPSLGSNAFHKARLTLAGHSRMARSAPRTAPDSGGAWETALPCDNCWHGSFVTSQLTLYHIFRLRKICFSLTSLISNLSIPTVFKIYFIYIHICILFFFFYGQWKQHSLDMLVQWFPDPELQWKYNIVFSFTLFMGQHFQWPFQFSLSCYLRITSFASSNLVFMLWWAGHSGGKFFSVWKTRNTVGIQAISFSMPFLAS